jgi:hypothetical protein
MAARSITMYIEDRHSQDLKMRVYQENGTRPEILERVEALGFVVFESQDYDLNIIGERNPRGEADQFDDWLHVIYKERGIWQWHAYQCTTDAGMYYLKNYHRQSGTAILCHPQQMRGAYMLDFHRGKYEALCQRKPVSVWRDRNKDHIHDMMGDEDIGYHGINIHRSNLSPEGAKRVGKYSAGCTVLQRPDDFDELIELCKKQIKKTGYDTFTYTLILGL